MTYEQVTVFDSPPIMTSFRSLDSEGKIYSKLDYLTAVFEDCSLSDVLNWLGLGDCVVDFLTGFYERCRGYDQRFIFNYNGCILETSSFHYYGDQMEVDFFDVVLPKIRLDLSGKALDFLRSINIEIDKLARENPAAFAPLHYHFTRADFAFDFVNYKPGFVDKLIEFVSVNRLPSMRIPVLHLSSGISCTVRTGKEKTVYLGTPQSDRLLRVYDKRMEHIDLATGVYKKSNPFNDPESWYRIEWQTRNTFAAGLLASDLEDKHILKQIFERYAFAEATPGYVRQRRAVGFWQELFDWADVERRIIQNKKYVSHISPDQIVINRFESIMMRTFLLYYSIVGREGIEKRANDYLQSLYRDDPVSQRRYSCFLSKLTELYNCHCGIDVNNDTRPGLFNECGRFIFRL